MAKLLISSYNPFNTNEEHFVLNPNNEWVYYTYYNTGTANLNLINKKDIFNNTVYFFIVGPGNHGYRGGFNTDSGNGGGGVTVKGNNSLDENYTNIKDFSLKGTNFNIDITLGRLKKSDNNSENNKVIDNAKTQVKYTNDNGVSIDQTFQADINKYNYSMMITDLVKIPSTPFYFRDGLANKTIINGIVQNPYGKYIGGDGGPSANDVLVTSPVTGVNGGGGGGGARSTASSNNHYGGNGINGGDGQDRTESHQRKGGDGGDGKNFSEGGVGGGGGGGGLGASPSGFPLYLNRGDPGDGGTGGLGAIMIYYKKNFFVEFKYKFKQTTAGNNFPLPIKNDSKSFLDVTTYTTVLGTGLGSVITVTITFRYSDIYGNDGFSFYQVEPSNYYSDTQVEIIKFGGIPFNKTYGNHFKNLKNFKITATDVPKILPNTSLENSFSNCLNFNSNISNWDFSNVTNMSSMFANTNLFNQNISNWNVSNVTNMSGMFANTSSFNQNISNWDVSKVTNMSNMFFNALKFNNLNNQMLWNCNNELIASNFGTNSLLSNSQNYRPAVRFDNKTSIETPTINFNQQFIYSFDNTGLTTFNISKVPIINNSNSFSAFTNSNVIWNISGNTTTVFINFTYVNINNDDGLSFQTTLVRDFYKNNTITIIQFGNIPLSNNISNTTNKFAFNPTTPYVFQDLLGVKLINNAIDLPIILNPTTATIGKQIMYREFVNTGVNNVNITTSSSYKKIRIYAIGAGGSGGAGGGDRTGRKGTNGAGGGGGGYFYSELTSLTSLPSLFLPLSKILVNVGVGGASVSGGDVLTSDSNDGTSGKNGENTYVKVNNLATLIAYGGSGGGGGHASASAKAGKGGWGKTNSGSDSDGINGGNSGYENNTNNFGILTLPYGNGGDGTPGTYDPNNSPTGSGQNGYVRIYFYN